MASGMDGAGTAGARRGSTVGLTSVAFFMVALDALVVTTALPSIGADLHAGLSSLEWTVNAYGLAYAAGIVTATALGDRYGRRRVFTLGLALFTLASAGCALAPDMAWLLAARAVQGVGAAAVMPLSLTILTEAFPAARRGAVVGIWGGIGGLAVASGPLIGGGVTEGLDWHWIFWVNVPIGLVATVLARVRLSESHGRRVRLDLPGMLLLTGAAFALAWALMRANTVGWTSVQTMGVLVAAVAGGCAFVAWERRTPEPMIPLRLFRSRVFAAANLASLLMIGALSAAVFLIAQYFQVVLGYSPLGTGLRMLPWTATPILIAPLAGSWSDRVGRRPVLAAGLALQAIGLGWVAFVAGPATAYPVLVAPLLIAGVGISMALPTSATAALSAVAPAHLGKASGVNSTVQRLGGVLAVAGAGAVFASHGHLGDPTGFVAGFGPALASAAVLSALGALTALALGPRPDQAPAPSTASSPAAPAEPMPATV